jgi:peptidoglycan hydrolase-like protein with peptidoglycan-binding domain
MKVRDIVSEASVTYTNQGATRSLKIPQRLYSIIQAAGKAAGIDKIEIFSGGQVPKGQQGPRTGSTRHDTNVGAADVYLYAGGKQLSTAQEDPRVAAFIQAARAGGAVGIGAGPGYMSSRGIHVGFGKPAVWGKGGSGANAPSWVKAAYNAGAGGQAPATPASGATRTRTPGAKFTSLQNTGKYDPTQSERVKKVQTLLQRLGYDVGDTGIDGKYGPRTERAVRRFQQDNGLQVDGIVGIETAKALTATKSRSPRGQLTNIQQGSTTDNTASDDTVDSSQLSGTAMERATTLVKELEGYKPNAYPDYKQYSIGYGSKATGPNEVIDQAEAERRLRSELQAAFEHVTRVQRQGNYDWNDDQIAALMSFTYNIGNVIKLTANGTRDDDTIAAKMLLYRNVTKKSPDGKPIKVPLPGLVKRRNKEAALFTGSTDEN